MTVATMLQARYQRSSGLYQMFGELCDAVILTPSQLVFMEEVPVRFIANAGAPVVSARFRVLGGMLARHRVLDRRSTMRFKTKQRIESARANRARRREGKRASSRCALADRSARAVDHRTVRRRR